VIRAAVEAGLDVVALTDHDTALGWPEATAAASAAGIELVTGIEVSTRYEHAGVHLLAYLPDVDDPGLAVSLDRVLEGRRSRVPAILSRLSEVGIELTEDDVRRVAVDTPSTGRPHVADALVARGVVADRAEAFERYLNPGRPGYASRSAEDLEDMIPTVVAAGGVPVIAHPWARTARKVLTEEAFARLQALGLAGIEVDHQGHTLRMRDELRGIAHDLGLVVTGSSDFHGTGKVDHDLGCNTTDPGEYARILDLAATARSARAAR
jgi:predicted metal-dependent phosphoesterase TrpH